MDEGVRGGGEDGEADEPLSLAARNPFRWVLCVGEVMARDEDLFTTLQSLFEGAGSSSALAVTSASPHELRRSAFASPIDEHGPDNGGKSGSCIKYKV